MKKLQNYIKTTSTNAPQATNRGKVMALYAKLEKIKKRGIFAPLVVFTIYSPYLPVPALIFSIAPIKSCIKFAPLLINNPDNTTPA
jgi:hypothetical protein